MSVPNDMGMVDRLNAQREEDEIRRLMEQHKLKEAWAVVTSAEEENRLRLYDLFNEIHGSMENPYDRFHP